MSNRSNIVSVRESAKLRTAAEIEKRFHEQASKLIGLRQALDQLDEDRAAKIASGDLSAEDIIAESRRRKAILEDQIVTAEELVAVYSEQLHQARYREWGERKAKRREELEQRCAPAVAKYREVDEHLTAIALLLSELMALDVEIQQFNRSSNEEIGYVVRPEHRVRGNGPHVPPLWDQLQRIYSVYPDAGFLKIKLPSTLPDEPPAPKPSAPSLPQAATDTPAPAARSLHINVHRASLPPAEAADSNRSPAEQPSQSQSLVRRVIRTSPDPAAE